MIADHKVPLLLEHLKKGSINLQNMRSLKAVQPQCPACSARQGAKLSAYSKKVKKWMGW